MNKPVDKIPELVCELYAIVEKFEALYPGRKFTPDGHLVGSIGEVLAANEYNLELLPNSTETHDAISNQGKLVQIKATQTSSIAISSEPDYLIVLSLNKNGGFAEIYNGPGKLVWQHAGKMQKNGQRRISFSKLCCLMQSISPEQQVEKGVT